VPTGGSARFEPTTFCFVVRIDTLLVVCNSLENRLSKPKFELTCSLLFASVGLGNCQISVSKTCLKPASCYCDELGGKHCQRTSCHFGACRDLAGDEPMRLSLVRFQIRL
jgi:putative hemolysin